MFHDPPCNPQPKIRGVMTPSTPPGLTPMDTGWPQICPSFKTDRIRTQPHTAIINLASKNSIIQKYQVLKNVHTLQQVKCLLTAAEKMWSQMTSCILGELLFSFFGCQRFVLGLRKKVVPFIDRRGFKRPIRALGEYVIRCVLMDSSLSNTFEPAATESDKSIYILIYISINISIQFTY